MPLRMTWAADAGQNGGFDGIDLGNDVRDDVEPAEQPLSVIRQAGQSTEHGRAKSLQKVKSDPDKELDGGQLPDVRMQLAEQAPTSGVAASAMREAVPEPSSKQSEPVVSPFKEKAAQKRGSESEPNVAAEPVVSPFKEKAAQKRDSESEPKPEPKAAAAAKQVKKKLILPAAPTASKQKRSKRKQGSSEEASVPAEPAAATVASGSSSAKQDPGRAHQSAADRPEKPTAAAEEAAEIRGANAFSQGQPGDDSAAAAGEIRGADVFSLGQPGNDSAAEADILEGPPAPDAALPALRALPEPMQSQPSDAEALAASTSPSRTRDSTLMPGSGGGLQQPGSAQANESQPEDRGTSMPRIAHSDAPPTALHAGGGPTIGERAGSGQPGSSEPPAQGPFAESSGDDAQPTAGQGSASANVRVVEVGAVQHKEAFEPIPDSVVLIPDPGMQCSSQNILARVTEGSL